MSGPEMLLKAAICAFVPKQTAENIAATIEGMLRDGSLDGIATLTTDIREIKQSLARIEFQNAKLFAAVQALGMQDRVFGSPGIGLGELVASEQRPILAAIAGDSGDAGGEPHDVRGGDVGQTENNRSEAAE